MLKLVPQEENLGMDVGRGRNDGANVRLGYGVQNELRWNARRGGHIHYAAAICGHRICACEADIAAGIQDVAALIEFACHDRDTVRQERAGEIERGQVGDGRRADQRRAETEIAGGYGGSEWPGGLRFDKTSGSLRVLPDDKAFVG